MVFGFWFAFWRFWLFWFCSAHSSSLGCRSKTTCSTPPSAAAMPRRRRPWFRCGVARSQPSFNSPGVNGIPGTPHHSVPVWARRTPPRLSYLRKILTCRVTCLNRAPWSSLCLAAELLPPWVPLVYMGFMPHVAGTPIHSFFERKDTVWIGSMPHVPGKPIHSFREKSHTAAHLAPGDCDQIAPCPKSPNAALRGSKSRARA